MKKLILSIFVLFITSFAFSQEKPTRPDLKDYKYKMSDSAAAIWHKEWNEDWAESTMESIRNQYDNPVFRKKLDSLATANLVVQKRISELESSNKFWKLISGLFCTLMLFSLLILGNEIQKNKKEK